MRYLPRLIAAVSALLAVSVLGTAQAGIITVTNDASGTGRAAFGANDTMDWTTVGADLALVTNPFSATSNGGLNLTVSQQGANPFQRRTEGVSSIGNFTDGNDLLWTNRSNGPISISFASPIAGIGFQINPNGSDTTTSVELFTASNTSLGLFNLTTNDRAQPSASFLGFTSDMVDIARISIGQPLNQDFIINQLSLITGPTSPPGPVPMPEPGSLAMTCLGLLGLGLALRLRRARGS